MKRFFTFALCLLSFLATAQNPIGLSKAAIRSEITAKSLYDIDEKTEEGITTITCNDGKDHFFIYYFHQDEACAMYTVGNQDYNQLNAEVKVMNKKYLKMSDSTWRDKRNLAVWILEKKEDHFVFTATKE